MRKIYTLIFFSLLLYNVASAQFTVIDTGIFRETVDAEKKIYIKKKVILIETKSASSLNRFIFIKTKVQVNTDGTPVSYHPKDLKAERIAINRIGNGVAVYKEGDLDKDKQPNNRFLTGHYTESIDIFQKYCESGFKTVPEGFTINWKSVIASSNGKPCIFKTGKFSGYFGSMTSLKNDLPVGERGECDCLNQVDPLTVNGFVLPLGTRHVLSKFNACLGDLVIAYNPENAKLVYAIINDRGPANKLGEGSVAFNKALLGLETTPRTYKETAKYATRNAILIAIIPQSHMHKVVKPFNNENIHQRITDIMHALELNTDEEVINFMKENSQGLY